jgi:hypothetical protein
MLLAVSSRAHGGADVARPLAKAANGAFPEGLIGVQTKRLHTVTWFKPHLAQTCVHTLSGSWCGTLRTRAQT